MKSRTTILATIAVALLGLAILVVPAVAQKQTEEDRETQEAFTELEKYLEGYSTEVKTDIMAQAKKDDFTKLCDNFAKYGPSAATAAKWLRRGWKKARLAGRIVCVMIDAVDGICQEQIDPWKEVKCDNWPPEKEM